MAINTKGTFLIIREVAKVMKSQEPTMINLGRHGNRDAGRGSIVNVSSTMAVVAVQGKISYATSKHAITGVTRAAVMDYKAAGIRTNQVCPIWVRTPMYTESVLEYPKRLRSWRDYQQLRDRLSQMRLLLLVYIFVPQVPWP